LDDCAVFYKLQNSPNLWPTFLHGKIKGLILVIIGWATFWAIFSQTHVVTLHKTCLDLLIPGPSLLSDEVSGKGGDDVS
jgi:hypothetical protein